MTRWAALACLALAACAGPPEKTESQGGYAGTVQKVFRVVRGADDSAMRLLGRLGATLAPVLRQHQETHQYVVRTPNGQILAQSDQEYPVGECVRVIPETASAGPAFRYGEARVVPCH
jgi:starvation-inducible outer membrane lipoprotein